MRRRKLDSGLADADLDRAIARERLIDAKRAAHFLGVSTKTLGRLVKGGRVEYVRVGGPDGAIRFRLDDVKKSVWSPPKKTSDPQGSSGSGAPPSGTIPA